MSVLQQSELPPDVSVLQQSLDVFFTTFRSTAVISQIPPGTVHTAVEQRHQTCLGTAQTAVKNAFRPRSTWRSTACYSIEQTQVQQRQHMQAAVGHIHSEVAQSTADKHMQWQHWPAVGQTCPGGTGYCRRDTSSQRQHRGAVAQKRLDSWSRKVTCRTDMSRGSTEHILL